MKNFKPSVTRSFANAQDDKNAALAFRITKWLNARSFADAQDDKMIAQDDKRFYLLTALGNSGIDTTLQCDSVLKYRDLPVTVSFVRGRFAFGNFKNKIYKLLFQVFSLKHRTRVKVYPILLYLSQAGVCADLYGRDGRSERCSAPCRE